MMQTNSSSLTDRLMGVVTFKAPVYKDIAHDASAMQPAAIIVIAVAVVSGLISGLLGQGGLVIGLITALLGVLLGWVIGSWLTAFVAKTIFKGETNTAEMMRVQGHTYIFNILSIIPVIGGIAAAGTIGHCQRACHSRSIGSGHHKVHPHCRHCWGDCVCDHQRYRGHLRGWQHYGRYGKSISALPRT